MLRPLNSFDAPCVRRFLDGNPERDVYLRGLVWRLGVTLPSAAGTLMGWFEGAELKGVFLHSPVIVLACDRPAGLAAFAAWTARWSHSQPITQLISPRSMTGPFLAALSAMVVLPPLRLDRPSMPGMRVDRRGLVCLPSSDGDGSTIGAARLRPANDSDLGTVALACKGVTREELGVDPEELDPLGFGSTLARRVRAGREYLWMDGDQLLFRAAVSAATPEAVLIEGVYTPPSVRGRGFGTRGMHALSDRLLKWHRRVVLFVGRDNLRAQRVYNKLGFQVFDDYQAVYFDAEAAEDVPILAAR